MKRYIHAATITLRWNICLRKRSACWPRWILRHIVLNITSGAVGAQGGEIWAIDYGTVQGDPEDELTQKTLVERLSKPFMLKDGRQISSLAVVMDCNGHAWKAMLEFCAPYKGWIYAIRGEVNSKSKFKPELTLTFKVHPEVKCEYRSLNVHQLKKPRGRTIEYRKARQELYPFPRE